MRSVNIGLIGLGTVGGGVARLIQTHHDDYVEHYGVDLQIRRACARRLEEAERVGLGADVFTDDWHNVVSDPDVDVVVELIGGEHPAMDIFQAAFANGKHMVTANKALLGRHVEQLAHEAAAAGVQLRCEAAAAGGIPIVNVLEHELVGNEILTIAGIMNGTTNYILSRMDNEGKREEKEKEEGKEQKTREGNAGTTRGSTSTPCSRPPRRRATPRPIPRPTSTALTPRAR